jgi:hypothetical protein
MSASACCRQLRIDLTEKATLQASLVIVVIQRIFLMYYGGCGVSQTSLRKA